MSDIFFLQKTQTSNKQQIQQHYKVTKTKFHKEITLKITHYNNKVILNSILYILCTEKNWAQGRLATIETNLPDGSLKRHKAPSTTDGDVSNGYGVGICPPFFSKHPPARLVVDLREVYISVETIYYITPVGSGGMFENGRN